MTLEFHTPALTDRDAAAAAANACHARENDVSFVNLYLLRRKYGTEIAFHDGFLLRRYRAGIRAGCYGFPVGTGDLPAALHLMQADAAAQNQPFRMTLLTQEQCRILAEIAPDTYDSMGNMTRNSRNGLLFSYNLANLPEQVKTSCK